MYQQELTKHTNHISENPHIQHFYILQYSKDCGKSCHDLIWQKARDMNLHYEVVQSDHALIRSDYNQFQSLLLEMGSNIHGHSPLLPELKIGEDVDLDESCSNLGDSVELLLTTIPKKESDFIEIETLINAHPHLFANNIAVPRPLLHQIQILHMSLKCSSKQEALTQLSLLPAVQWIEIRHKIKPFTYWANGILQSGEATVNILNEAGLNGENEILGVSDTGLDVNSCYYYDENVPFIYNEVNLDHRKVIYYNTYVNGIDEDGHGTLVAGAAAGKCLDPTSAKSRFNGMAPDSKIAFFDIGDHYSYLTVPSDLYTGLFSVLYSAGAKIQSMSWGASSNSYTADAR